MLCSKKIIERAAYIFCAKDIQKIRHLLKGKDVVSFDVFDTLLKRDVLNPGDVFDLMERELEKAGKPYAKGFAGLRREAERRAKEARPDDEISLCDIYSSLPLEGEVRQELMDMECKTELKLSAPNPPIRQIYKICLEQNKKILFLSDMYLPEKTVQMLLDKNGYTKGTLYVSAENGCTKRSGRLFTYVGQKENIDKNKWCHIGDHVLSDFFIPQTLGIRSVLIERAPKHDFHVESRTYRDNAGYRQLAHFIDTRICQYTTFYEKIGYAVLGPLLYGFSQWINREIPKDQSIIFLSREGELLKKAFEIISDRPSTYFFISRRAAMGAYLSQVSDYNAVSQEKMRTMKKGHTYKELALNYGLSDNEIETVFRSAGLDEDKVITSPEMEESALKAIWPTAKKKSELQLRLLQRYIEQLDLLSESAVVDVGWYGTVQTLLNQMPINIHGRKMSLSGYYIGKYKKKGSSFYCNDHKKGFLFADDPDPAEAKGREQIMSTSAFFELMFLSTDGSTESYSEDKNGRVYPVRGRPDNDDASAIEKIRSLQKAGLQFVSDMASSPARELIRFDPAVSGGNYYGLVSRISNRELRSLRSFKERDGDSGAGASLVAEHGLIYYLLHPVQFKTDFIRNTCKAFFLKSVFKLPLPYVSILTLLRKRFRTY